MEFFDTIINRHSYRGPFLDQAVDPGLLATQRLEPADLPIETAFEDDDVVDSLTDTGATEIDHSFIEELDNSMAEEISQDQLKA